MKSEVGVAVYRHTRLASDDVSLRTTPLLTPGGANLNGRVGVARSFDEAKDATW